MLEYAEMKSRFALSPFRSGFFLTERDREYLAVHGWDRISVQTENLIRMRLAPANPFKDGKQTPMRGHPVFKAQHATATCCRSCLQKWHHIPQGRVLTEEEIAFVVRMITGWLKDHAGNLPDVSVTPDLF